MNTDTTRRDTPPARPARTPLGDLVELHATRRQTVTTGFSSSI